MRYYSFTVTAALLAATASSGDAAFIPVSTAAATSSTQRHVAIDPMNSRISSGSNNSSNNNNNNNNNNTPYSSILQQPNGRINAELAERLYKWEHQAQAEVATMSSRQGLRLVQELVQETDGRANDDLIQEGIMALMQARADYNAGFEAFATQRIRAALNPSKSNNSSNNNSNRTPLSMESTMIKVPQVESTLEERSTTTTTRRRTTTTTDRNEYMDPSLKNEGDDTMWIHQQHVSGMLRDMIPDPQDDGNDDSDDLQMLLASSTLTRDELRVIEALYGVRVGSSSSSPSKETAKRLRMTSDQIKVLLESALHKLRLQAEA